jgi:hypothetical protein
LSGKHIRFLKYAEHLSDKRLHFSDKMTTSHPHILARIAQQEPGAAFTPKDFLDIATRDATDQTLKRLVAAGVLLRIGRGLYAKPRFNGALGVNIPPDLDEVADAIGRQSGSRVVPSGAVAANRLGISTQVPAKLLYLSDGRSREVRVGNYTIQIKHVPPKELPVGNKMSAMVFQALRFLGRDAITDQEIQTIRAAMSPADRQKLLDDAKYTTGWICECVRKIAAVTEAAHG